MKTCIILVPVYQKLSEIDQLVLKNLIDNSKNFTKAFICPNSFFFDSSFDEFSCFEIFRFDDIFFKNIEGYNRLMLSIDFYNTFINYKYMLIHQLDAFMFKDELQYWCDKDYDYIGAPWYKPSRIYRKSIVTIMHKIFSSRYTFEEKKKWELSNNIGNGGFSLRKIKTFINILNTTEEKTLSKFLYSNNHFFNEDVFWSIEAPKLTTFKKPYLYEALKFSVEGSAAEAYKKNKQQLPFGCHGFDLPNECIFWQQYLPFKIITK